MSTNQTLSPRDKLAKVRYSLFKKRPFYGELLMYLDLEEDKEQLTLGVKPDGELRYNPDYIDDADSEEEVTFLLAHELGHFITRTVGESRKNGRDKLVTSELPEDSQDVNAINTYEKDGKEYAVYTLWNVASDYAVNDILEQDGFCVPEDSKTPDRFKNQSAEENYAQLDDEIEEGDDDIPPQMKGKFKRTDDHELGEGQGDGEGEGGKQKQGKAGEMSEEEKKRQEKKWDGRIKKAAEGSDRQGDFPGQLGEIVDDIINPTLSWRSLLNQYISREIVWDMTFSSPHKKSYSMGVYLPDVERENLDVTIAIDTSGSISSELLSQFLGEVQGIKDSYQSVEMDIILADAKVQDVHTFKNNQPLNPTDIEMKGRGGTDHRPVFDWVNNNKNGSRILVCLTDGYTTFPDNPPKYDTLWAVTSDGIEKNEFPFGKVVRVGEH